MSLKFKYWLFIGIVHLFLIVIIFKLFQDAKVFFILSEIGVALSLYLSYLLYNALVRPIEMMQSGTNAIAAKDYNTRFLKTGSEDMDRLILVFNRMLDELRTERISTESQGYFLQRLIELSPIGIIILDFDDRISDANTQAKNLLNLKHDYKGIMLNALSSALAKKIARLQADDVEIIHLSSVERYKCQVTNVIQKGFKRKCFLIEDLTKELLEMEKQAYGKVIRMMSHEVNNSMGAVNSILQSVIQFGFTDTATDPSLKESLEVAIDRNESLGKFVKNFAEVIRLPSPYLQWIDINEIILQVISTIRPLAEDQSIALLENLSKELITLSVDRTQIEQVLINIFKNSIEAIGEQSRGSISIKSQKRAPQIIIADNGPGITDENKENIFTPFFSTKPTGQGIGLMLIRDILINHEASFNLYTDTEKGLTYFEISFTR